MRLISVASVALAVLLPGTLVFGENAIHVGNLTITTPNSYRYVETGHGGISLVNDDKSLLVQVIRLDGFPAATHESIQTIVDRVEGTERIVVTHMKSAIRKDVPMLTGEGTATLRGDDAHFWFLSIPVGSRGAAAVAFAPDDKQDDHKGELLEILKSTTSKLDGTQRYFDFESGGLQNRWSAQGPITVQRTQPPIQYAATRTTHSDNQQPSRTAKDNAVHLTTTGKSILLAVEGLAPRDWTEIEAVSLWIYRAEENEQPTTIELQIYGSNPRARFWRKLVIDHHGWRRYSVPLRWMRWGSGLVPDWSDIARFGIYFREASDIWVDSIALEDDDKQRGATIVGEDLAELAFADKLENVKVTNSDDLVLVTAVPALDTDELSNHISTLKKQIESDFSFLPATRQAPKLIVLPTRVDYQQFSLQLAAAFNSQTRAPETDGSTMLDISSSYWSASHGTLRPVYTHEYVHGLLSRMLRVANRGDWLHEGAAAYYQLKAHPQENISEIVQKGVDDRNFSSPLEALCNGKQIPMNRYWQAMTMVELLITNQAYRAKLQNLTEAFQAQASTDLGPPLEQVFGKNWTQLTDDWRNHCRARY